MRFSRIVLVMAVCGVAALSMAQTAQKPAFEVVSIKAITSSNRFGTRPISIAGGRFVANDNSLSSLTYWAYRSSDGKPLLRSQIVGLPAWAETDRFDVQATPEGESRDVPLEEMQLMVQSLLQDRFQLKAHYETRELPIYNLVVAKTERMKLSADQTPPPAAIPEGTKPGTLLRGRMRSLGKPGPAGMGVVMSGTGISLPTLKTLLQGYVDRPVTDKTQLQGLFDIQMEFTLQSSSPTISTGAAGGNGTTSVADPQGTSIFTALQEDLGLKLESSKGPVEVLVIDSVQKPSEN